jgi:hypothetical protein
MANYLASTYAAAARQAIKDASDIADSKLDKAIEMGAIKESLLESEQVLADMESIIDHLETAHRSLNECGYSEEWLNVINMDGSFLPAIGINKMDLLGSDDAKFQASMEGIVDTIWSWIKKIWNWIIDAIGKIVRFIRGLIGSFRDSKNTSEKAINALKYVASGLTAEDFKKIGEAINALGKDGKYPSVQAVAERIGVEASLATWLAANSFGIVGIDVVTIESVLNRANMEVTEPNGKKHLYGLLKAVEEFKVFFPDEGVWSSLVEKYKNSPEVHHGNLIIKCLVDTIRDFPSKLPDIFTIRGSEFMTVSGGEMAACMRSSGIVIEEFAPDRNDKSRTTTYKINCLPYADSVEKVDYTSHLKDVDQVISLLKSQSAFIIKAEAISKNIAEKTAILNSRSATAARFMGECHKTSIDAARCGVGSISATYATVTGILQQTTRHLAEAVTLMAKFNTDIEYGARVIGKIAETIFKIAPQFKPQEKK